MAGPMNAHMMGQLAEQLMPPEMDERHKQFAGMAVKKGVEEYKQDDRGTMWLCGIPIQTGPGNAYSRNLTHWMHAILVIQAAACAMKILILHEFIGSMWMLLIMSLGYYAMIHDMNITVLCLWGILCLLQGVFSVIGLILPFIIGLVKLKVLRLIATICVPLAYFLGAVFAVHLYHVSADEADVDSRIVPAKVDHFGAMFDRTDPFTGKGLMQAAGDTRDTVYEGYKARTAQKAPLPLNSERKHPGYAACC